MDAQSSLWRRSMSDERVQSMESPEGEIEKNTVLHSAPRTKVPHHWSKMRHLGLTA